MGEQSWMTPRPWFRQLHDRYRFTIDAAADRSNALLPRYWTEEENALAQDWDNERVYCNPPYERIYPWVAKAEDSFGLVVMLLPASTSTRWFHDFIWNTDEQTWYWNVKGYFLRGRLAFGDPTGRGREAPRYDNLLVVWHPELI